MKWFIIFRIGFKERWFRLKYNLLFYFKINGCGQINLDEVRKNIMSSN